MHTTVPESFRGKGINGTMDVTVLDFASTAKYCYTVRLCRNMSGNIRIITRWWIPIIIRLFQKKANAKKKNDHANQSRRT